MSKTQKEKVIITMEQAPVLDDLDFKTLVKDFYKYRGKQADAEVEANAAKVKKDNIGLEIAAAIETVKADSVLVNVGKFELKATLVKSEESSKTDEDKLKLNLMKIAKLDAQMIAKVFAASQEKIPARKPYVLVTPQ